MLNGAVWMAALPIVWFVLLVFIGPSFPALDDARY